MILLSAFRGEGGASGNLLLSPILGGRDRVFICLTLFRG